MKGFDYCFYEMKHVSGAVREPAEGMFNIISCFADNKTARMHPDWVAVSERGKATRSDGRYKMLWDWLCPNNDEVKNNLLELIEDTSSKDILGIRLDCVQYAMEDFCKCARCAKMIKQSKMDWVDFRSSSISNFVRDVRKASKVPLMIGLEPDPAFLNERFGLNVKLLNDFVDAFCVPIYMDYSITYWCDVIAYAFRQHVKKKLVIDLYAGYPKKPIENLFRAMIAVAKYADTILISTFDHNLALDVLSSLKDERFFKMVEEKDCKPLSQRLKIL